MLQAAWPARKCWIIAAAGRRAVEAPSCSSMRMPVVWCCVSMAPTMLKLSLLMLAMPLLSLPLSSKAMPGSEAAQHDTHMVRSLLSMARQVRRMTWAICSRGLRPSMSEHAGCWTCGPRRRWDGAAQRDDNAWRCESLRQSWRRGRNCGTEWRRAWRWCDGWRARMLGVSEARSHWRLAVSD